MTTETKPASLPQIRDNTKCLSKDAFDGRHVKSVTAWAILHNGEMAGRIVANWSDNPAGSVCTATVHIWGGPLEYLPAMSGKAGGYGYCKFSAAVYDALNRAADVGQISMSGAGESAVSRWLESFGYTTARVI